MAGIQPFMSAPRLVTDEAPLTRALGGWDTTLPGLGEPSAKTTPPTICKADVGRDDLTGLSLGQYELGKSIGGGGMGRVFAARHVHLDRTFAIKFIGTAANHSPEAHSRFEQEVLALGKLQHPHIVSAVDAGSADGIKYLVTELIVGEDLAQLVQQHGPLPCAEACELMRQAALGLAYSHRLGFLHRDIKPSNLILDREGNVKLLDFGLVCNANTGHDLTSCGMLGTWDFVAPEQAQDARQVDARSDLYSLGCTLLYLLSGRPPFSGERYSTAAAKLTGHLFETPTWLENAPADLPPGLIPLLKKMLAKKPAERFQQADEVVAALSPFASSTASHAMNPPRTTPNKFNRNQGAAIAAAVAAVAIPCGWFALSSPQPPQTTAPMATTAVPVVFAKPIEEAPVAAEPARVTSDSQTTTNAGAVRVDFSKSSPQRSPVGFGEAPE
jgi:serine/threonine protein kinase